MIQRVKRFFTESWTELRHVNWPTRQEAIRLTSIVIAMSVGLAVFLGLFDYIFTTMLKAAIAP